LLTALIDKAELVAKFARSIKGLLDHFRKDTEGDPGTEITAKDCDDAVNILKPIASHGGTQTFNTINGRWRQRMGEERLQALLQESLRHVDDHVQPRAQEIGLSVVASFLRSRRPLR
jgi:hypothetical protein